MNRLHICSVSEQVLSGNSKRKAARKSGQPICDCLTDQLLLKRAGETAGVRFGLLLITARCLRSYRCPRPRK